MHHLPPFLLPVLGAFALAACTPAAGGVEGEETFRATAEVTEFAAPVPLETFVTCFRSEATFFPLSGFGQNNDVFIYRLAIDELWFEELVVNRTPEGIAGVLSVSGRYDDGWNGILVRDRLPAIAACQTEPGAEGRG